MNREALEKAAVEVLKMPERHEEFGEYGPSQVTGCPLKVVLDEMTDKEVIVNSWMFQGTAVHHYLRSTGKMKKILSKAGYSPLNTEFEVRSSVGVGEGVTIDGTCDVLTRNGDGERSIIDVKYSSLPADSGHGRIYKYFSQANAYAHIFNAEEYGLMMIKSTSNDLFGMQEGNESDIVVLEGEVSEDNWELVKEKARLIHQVLENAGYESGKRWSVSMLEKADVDFWKELMDVIPKKHSPSYEKECNHCSHSEYCPVYQGKLGGVKSLVP